MTSTGEWSGRATFRAPGRVNLIGGHVDFHEGLVATMASDLEARVTVTPRGDGRILATSAGYPGTVDVDAAGRDPIGEVSPAWGRIVAAVASELGRRGRPPVGATLDITSTLPAGAGLSSSAALGVALACALAHAGGQELPPVELALAVQAAEQLAFEVPCGIQDQLTAVTAREGSAVMIDCRTLTAETLPLPPGVAVVVVHSGVARELAASPWAARRAETFEAAAALGLRVLRDATRQQVASSPRARHVVSEIERVREFAAACRAGDAAHCGALMLASHASSRDDMETSTPELDELVDRFVAAGAHGARLTGGGFGGCVVALVPRSAAAAIIAAVVTRYRTPTGHAPRAWQVEPSAAAGRVT